MSTSKFVIITGALFFVLIKTSAGQEFPGPPRPQYIKSEISYPSAHHASPRHVPDTSPPDFARGRYPAGLHPSEQHPQYAVGYQQKRYLIRGYPEQQQHPEHHHAVIGYPKPSVLIDRKIFSKTDSFQIQNSPSKDLMGVNQTGKTVSPPIKAPGSKVRNGSSNSSQTDTNPVGKLSAPERQPTYDLHPYPKGYLSKKAYLPPVVDRYPHPAPLPERQLSFSKYKPSHYGIPPPRRYSSGNTFPYQNTNSIESPVHNREYPNRHAGILPPANDPYPRDKRPVPPTPEPSPACYSQGDCEMGCCYDNNWNILWDHQTNYGTQGSCRVRRVTSLGDSCHPVLCPCQRDQKCISVPSENSTLPFAILALESYPGNPTCYSNHQHVQILDWLKKIESIVITCQKEMFCPLMPFM